MMIAARILTILITVLSFHNSVLAAVPDRVIYQIRLDGDGEAWGNVRKSSGAAMDFHATKKSGGWTTSWPESRPFMEEDQLPQYVDLKWHKTNSDVLPDNRRYSVRLPLRTAVPEEVATYFDTANRRRGSSWRKLYLNIVLEEEEIEVSWEFVKLRRSSNPLHYLKHKWTPTGAPPIKKILDTGGPLRFAIEIKGDAPQLTDDERDAILRQNGLTNKLVWEIKNREALISDDASWIESALREGADVEGMSVYDKRLGDSRRPNFTLLMLAAGNGTPDLINLFLKYGANINARNKNGDTPLMYAVLSGKIENVRTLLSYGANPNIQNLEGSTALTYAQQQSFDEVAEVLVKAGASR